MSESVIGLMKVDGGSEGPGVHRRHASTAHDGRAAGSEAGGADAHPRAGTARGTYSMSPRINPKGYWPALCLRAGVAWARLGPCSQLWYDRSQYEN